MDKLNSTRTSGQPEKFNMERAETDTPSSDPNGKGGQGLQSYQAIQKKKRIISQDDDSLSRSAPSDVEEDLQQEQQRRLSQRDFFVVNDTELWSEGQIENILSKLTEEFNNDKLCDPKINSKLGKAINEVCGKKLTSEKLKVRLNKHLKL